MAHTGDSWLDAKSAQCEEFEQKASRALEKPVQVGMSIERVKWQDGRAYIDDLHYFEVPEDVWNLQINGWQVAAKWLVDRRIRGAHSLAQADIDQYHGLIGDIKQLFDLLIDCGMKRATKERM